jgi:predicted Zn-dependent peptidase
MNHRIYRKILDNKLRIMMIPIEHTDTVAVGVFVKIGSRYETENTNGMSHFLEHMMFKGTRHYPNNNISEKLDSVGAVYNAETSHELTSYYIHGHKTDIELFIKIMIDIFTNPLFKEEDIITERGVVYEELNMYKDDISEILDDYIHETLFNNSSLKFPILGNKKILSMISRKDLLNFRKKFYVPERTVFVISGGFNRKKIFTMLQSRLSKLSNGTHDIIIPIQDPIIQTKPETYIINKPDISQTIITIAFRSHSFFSQYSNVYDIIGDILASGSSSRLFTLLRNKMGATYLSHAGNVSYTYEGAFMIHIGVDNKRIDEVIEKVMEEIKKLTKKGITKEELEKAKKIRITSFSLGLQTPQDLINYYGNKEIMYKVGAIPQHIQSKINITTSIEDYENIDINTVNKVIRDLFREEKLNIFICGTTPHKKIDNLNI